MNKFRSLSKFSMQIRRANFSFKFIILSELLIDIKSSSIRLVVQICSEMILG